MEIPDLEHKGRPREFRSYTIEKTDEVVYKYLFEGMSTRSLDNEVLGKNEYISKGWQSHGILKYYGLGVDFKGIFKGLNPEEAMRIIPDDHPAYALVDVIGRYANIYTNIEPDAEGLYRIKVKPGMEKMAQRCVRANQYQFRESVLDVYGGACCITGVKNSKLIIASHIKPWSRSSPIQKTDPCNGLCLNRMHDAAFDTGLMTVDSETLRVMYAPEIEETMPEDTFYSFFRKYDGKKIRLPIDGFEPGAEYLQYHNAHVFERNVKQEVYGSELLIDGLI